MTENDPINPDVDVMYEEAQNRDEDPTGEDVADIGNAEVFADTDPDPLLNDDADDELSDLDDGEDTGDMDNE